jgi:YVTN family beta-propeller protein
MDGSIQKHTLHVTNDVDWFRIAVQAGTTYTITTLDLVAVTDTILHLYDSDGKRVLMFNDDYVEGSFASRIVWTAPGSGTYFVRARDFYGRGLCLGYTITGVEGAREPKIWLPLLIDEPPALPTPTATPTPTPLPTPPTPSIVYPTVVPVPGMAHPNAIAVDPITHRVYATSRDNNTVYVLDGLSLSVLKETAVSSEPWGIVVNPQTGKLYVSHFQGGQVLVLDAMTLERQSTIQLGADLQFTLMGIHLGKNHVFVVDHARNTIVVIDGSTDTVRYEQRPDADGAFGIAVNPILDQAYVSFRNSGTVLTLDGKEGYRLIPDQTIRPCGGVGSSPYGMGFNPVNGKLYVACSPGGGVRSVDFVSIYGADAEGLHHVANVPVDRGGEDAGGGIAINPATGHVFVTNSASNTVSVISGASNRVIASETTGDGPFGAGIDTVTGRVFVGNRASNNLSLFLDEYPP